MVCDRPFDPSFSLLNSNGGNLVINAAFEIRKLNLTADQTTKWGTVTAVIRDGDFQTLCSLRSNDSVIATDTLKQMELAMTEGLNTIKKVQAPFNSFYTSLDTDQQNMLNGWFSHRGHR